MDDAKRAFIEATYTYCLNIIMGVPPQGIIGYTLVDEEFCICSFVSPPHTSNGFQADINWPLLAAAGVIS